MVGNYITHRLNLEEEEEVFGVCMIIEKKETIRNETKRSDLSIQIGMDNTKISI